MTDPPKLGKIRAHLNLGLHVGVPLLDLKAQFDPIRDDVMAAVQRVIEGQRFIMGPEVGELESAIAGLMGVEHAVACASGTDALLLALKTVDWKPADEVVTSPFTFFATAGAIVNAGARPVFVDIDPVTFLVTPEAMADACTERTRGVLPVDLFGQMAAMERYAPLARRVGAILVEDAAQAIGARREVDGTWYTPGQLGDIATLSFFPSKNLGCWGDGGMILTGDGDLAQKMRLLRTHGGSKMYHHDFVGTNSRLDTLQAAVLLAKLPHLSAWNAARRRHAATYDDAFADLDGITTPRVDPANEHVYHQYTIRVADDRDGLLEHLRGQRIGCAVYYPVPLHLQPCFADLGYRPGQLPEAERAARDVLSLPVGPELAADQLGMVVDAIRGWRS